MSTTGYAYAHSYLVTKLPSQTLSTFVLIGTINVNKKKLTLEGKENYGGTDRLSNT